MQSSSYRCVKGGTICQWKIYKRVTFSARMLYKRVKGWTSGGVSQYKTLLIPPRPSGSRVTFVNVCGGESALLCRLDFRSSLGTSEDLFPELRLVFEPTCFETD